MMANYNSVAPFYQLGRQIAFTVCYGDRSTEVTGEVMDTDAAWIAVKESTSGGIQWYNMDYIACIKVQE